MIPRWKIEGNSKLGYGFKGAVESERTDLKVYDIIMMILILIKVGGDEIWVGDVRVPGFTNAPES